MNPPNQTALAVPAAFEPENLTQAEQFADRLAKSSIIPSPLRQKPADVLVVLLTGRELGLSPMQSLRSLHVVEGRPCLSAELLVALCLRRPDICEAFTLVESTDAKATYRTKRRGSEPVSLSWTIDQAIKAGLANKNNWKSHPAAMLRARASSSLARAVYPDITTGIYGEDEIEAIDVTPTSMEMLDSMVSGKQVQVAPSRPGAARAAKDVTPAEKKPTPPKKPAAAAPIEDAQPADAEAKPHDAETGEVQAGDVPWDAEQEAEAARDAVLARVSAAPSSEALKALVPEIKALPEEMREQVRDVYGARLEFLKAEFIKAQAVLTDAAEEREPGSEG